MNAFIRFASASLLAGAAAVVAAPAPSNGIPPMPATPAPLLDLISAQPIVLAEPFEYAWMPDKPLVSAGYLLVLESQPDYLFSRQTEEPVLFAGSVSVERINNGYESGKLIAFVPSDVNEKGELTLDLKSTMIWWGSPNASVKLDAAIAASERLDAQRAGIKPFSAEKVDQALAKGGPTLHLQDKVQLLGEAGKLIMSHSPYEKEMADNFFAINGMQPTPKAAGKAPARK
jgi:hypothetical protein